MFSKGDEEHRKRSSLHTDHRKGLCEWPVFFQKERENYERHTHNRKGTGWDINA